MKHRESLASWVENLDTRVEALEKVVLPKPAEKPAEKLETTPAKPGE